MVQTLNQQKKSVAGRGSCQLKVQINDGNMNDNRSIENCSN